MLKKILSLSSIILLIGFSACHNNETKEEQSYQEDTIASDKPSEDEIKKGLLNKKVTYTPRGEDETKWTFVDLSEFLDIRIVEEKQDETYWEAKVDFDLQDYNTEINYSMSGIIQCKKDGSKWEVTNFKVLEYRKE
ncbi:hypothetical protein [Arcticibacterium luteifluviistationis]|uniref:Lipoprotein n=1 Tax=Arcticibacterium luteifluviistationis TaxID=1784714 RepID=A0A2Z4GF74_9BACT|nr:hypothetical protein [Arcticibacterium luteifluviistationis]AWV99956.1 hypothetical protein DJ013_17980 [Arcticibacterium luteifluviistationis]